MTMRTLLAIFILTNLFSCTDRETNNSDIQKNIIPKTEKTLEITAINAKFPLRLEELNLEDKDNTIHLNDGIVAKIEEVVIDYAKDFEFYDSSQTYKDAYINTIRLHDGLQTIYLVLLKHFPTSVVNSRILFYDNERKEFIDNEYEFKLYALYDYENGTLKVGYLKKLFELETPEIEKTDYNKDGITDYRFVRLWHNGTFNAIHTTILAVNKNKVDTLHFDEKPIGNDERLPE